MRVKHKELKKCLRKLGIPFAEFVEGLNLETYTHIELMLGDAELNEEEARGFMNAIGAEDAYNIIDWEAMHVARPSREQIFGYAY